MNAYETVFSVIRNIQPSDRKNARTFHDAFERHLKASCKTVIREYLVTDRGDGRNGYIDLVVLEPFRAAIELDSASPRKKSLFKLKGFEGEKFVVLRSSLKLVRC